MKKRLCSSCLVIPVSLVLAGASCNSKTPDNKVDEKTARVEAPSNADEPPPKPPEPELPPPLPALDGPHFAAFDLLVNRPLAHRVEYLESGPTVVVEAGSPDFARYIHGNHPRDWESGVELEGEPAAGLRKKRDGSMWIPALDPDGRQLQMRVYDPSRGDSRLSVKVNGERLEKVELEDGWQTLTFDLEPGLLRPENEIHLDFSNMGRIAGNLSGGAVGWVRVGHAVEARPVKEPAPPAASADAGGVDAGAMAAADVGSPDAGAPPMVVARPESPDVMVQDGPLTVRSDTGLAWHVWGLPDARLSLKIRGAEGCGVRTTVYLEKEDGEVASTIAEERVLVEGRGDVQETAVDLSKISGRVGRLELRQAGDCSEPPIVEEAALVVPGDRPIVPTADPPKYVVVWMVDTLRADHFPVHFETDVQAPNLQRLAEEGASFELAYVQGNESKTSHASFFSGMFPNKHRVLTRGHLKPYHHLLPEAMQDADYETGAYVANGYVSKPWGFVQGWDFYLNNLRSNYRIDGKSMAEFGAKWAKKHREKPFFLYLGTIDPHVTYRRHEELIGLYDTTPYNGRFTRACLGTELGKIKGGGIRVDARDRERIQNLYKNEITFNDQAFGELRKALEEAGMWEETMVVVTADHGDEFWEHGSVGHGHSVHQELVHVPIVLYYPPLIPGETVVSAGVDVLDIYPTIIDAIGGEKHEDVQGKSLLPLVHGVNGDYPEPALATQYLAHYGVQMENWKLYLKRGTYELFDRSSDPNEKKDVATRHPLASRWLLDTAGWFRAHRKRWDKASWGVASNLSKTFVQKLLEDEKE